MPPEGPGCLGGGQRFAGAAVQGLRRVRGQGFTAVPLFRRVLTFNPVHYRLLIVVKATK